MGLRERLQAGEAVLTAWSNVPDPLTVEILSALPFDAVTLDMQHGGHNEDSVLRSLPAVLHKGKAALVRIPVGRFDMASRALDFGAEAVIAPMVNTLDDARRFAAAMKYPPLGERSWGPTYGLPRVGTLSQAEWLEKSNSRALSFAMIETRAAVDVLDGILAEPGIDAIFVGPSDLSIAWTGGRAIDPTLDEMMPTIESIARRTRDAGKFAGIYVMDTATSGRYASMGFQLLAGGAEQALMRLGAESYIGAVRGRIAAAR